MVSSNKVLHYDNFKQYFTFIMYTKYFFCYYYNVIYIEISKKSRFNVNCNNIIIYKP